MKRIIFNNKGISLLELIISLALLGIIIIPISSLFIGSAKANKATNDKIIASCIAQREIERIKSLEKLSEENSIDKVQDKEYENFFYEINILEINNYLNLDNKEILINNNINLNTYNLNNNEYYFLKINDNGSYTLSIEPSDEFKRGFNGIYEFENEKNNTKKVINLLLDIEGESKSKLKVSNNIDGILNIYIRKGQAIQIDNLLGDIKVYRNYVDADEKNKLEAIIYEINIRVYRGDKLLEEFNAYKNII
ncbi:prepilin-type N-terminal cleavage/methylation domain-containing protein [Clostridium sp. D2Q-14]|uniref:type IV pilus modification PilV family protein n=1 Tax=Anaeromonas gelatinilytica TaxID=2683194 RepID=UPI00193BBF7D|nr:prepilin-type N-terminal cleavage/methylation domain-containing protein [Anaeromonas gelatinilytica]MBS4536190.1 prepilin-type N-terminal cleavage/methylation domain-containing protein [Anaeromonas gelatinilytica]